MAKRSKRKPRKKRYLLTAVALSTGTLLHGCGSAQDEAPGDETVEGVEGEPLPLPANPKGAVYDEGTSAPGPDDGVEGQGEGTEPSEADQAEPQAVEPEEGGGAEAPRPRPRPRPQPRPLPLPANPKGAHYDDGPFPPRPAPVAEEEG